MAAKLTPDDPQVERALKELAREDRKSREALNQLRVERAQNQASASPGS